MRHYSRRWLNPTVVLVILFFLQFIQHFVLFLPCLQAIQSKFLFIFAFRLRTKSTENHQDCASPFLRLLSDNPGEKLNNFRNGWCHLCCSRKRYKIYNFHSYLPFIQFHSLSNSKRTLSLNYILRPFYQMTCNISHWNLLLNIHKKEQFYTSKESSLRHRETGEKKRHSAKRNEIKWNK